MRSKFLNTTDDKATFRFCRFCNIVVLPWHELYWIQHLMVFGNLDYFQLSQCKHRFSLSIVYFKLFVGIRSTTYSREASTCCKSVFFRGKLVRTRFSPWDFRDVHSSNITLANLRIMHSNWWRIRNYGVKLSFNLFFPRVGTRRTRTSWCVGVECL